MQSRSWYRISVLLLLSLLYVSLTQKYRAYERDTPWFLSFSYNYCHGNVQTDQFLEVRYPSGMDGVHLFGKTAATIQCAALNRIGWTPHAEVAFNVLFGIAALSLWWSFLKRKGYSERWIAAFILLLGISEPMVSTMEKGRYEFLAFFLLSLALWLGLQGWELVAAFCAFMAVESEPFAIVVPVVIIVLLLLRTENRKLLLLKLTAAAVASAIIYQLLHPGAIHEMTSITTRLGFSVKGIFYVYFIQRVRHLPELAMILLGGWLYWKNRRKIPDRTALWLTSSVVTFFLLAVHANVAYQIFAIPFLLWLALEGYERAPGWCWVPALVFAGILFQYAYLAHVNLHEGFDAQDFAQVSRQIDLSAAILGIPPGEVHLCGDYSLWFAHPQGYKTCENTTPEKLHASNLFLCFDGPLQSGNLGVADIETCPYFSQQLRLREISQLNLRGHILHFEIQR
jgi:hypothetical protein